MWLTVNDIVWIYVESLSMLRESMKTEILF